MDDVVLKTGSNAALLQLTVRDLLVFMDWMNQAQNAFERGDVLLPIPAVESEKIKSWVRFVQQLEGRARQKETRQASLQANLEAQEKALGQLLSHLHHNIAAQYENLGLEERAQEVRKRAAASYKL